MIRSRSISNSPAVDINQKNSMNEQISDNAKKPGFCGTITRW